MTYFEFPALQQFFGCYLGQDWDLEYETWEQAVTTFRAEVSAEQFEICRCQLEMFLQKQFDEDEAWRDLLRMHCAYDPRPDGVRPIEWLALLKSEFDRNNS